MSGTWVSGWVTGDVVTAAEFKKGVGCIADSTLGSPAASIDFTSLPTTYQGLLLVVYAQSAIAGNADDIYVRLNGDSGGNYDLFGFRANNASVTINSAFGGSNGFLLGECPGANFNTRWSAHSLLLPNYASSARKSGKAEGGFSSNGVASSYYDAYSCFYNSVTAISRLTIRANGGNLVAGSRAAVYALGA